MTERKKNKKVKALSKVKKLDVFQNCEDLDIVIAAQEKKENNKKRYPLRINKQTVILVTKDKYNNEYAEAYRQKLNKINRE